MRKRKSMTALKIFVLHCINKNQFQMDSQLSSFKVWSPSFKAEHGIMGFKNCCNAT